ncbi:MAG: response regulator transcription factor [Erythrobacter sp.]
MNTEIADDPLVAIVDDQRDVRTTVGRGLAAHGFRAHPFASGQDLLEALEYLEPDCILLDMRMPGLDGIETLKAIPERRRSIPVVFFTSHGDIPLAVEAMRLGAADFIEKPGSFDQIATKIRAALATRSRPADQSYTSDEARTIIANLTAREREIMQLASDGLQSKEIAARLDISVRTVESHRHHAIQKIGDGRLINIARLFRAAEGC